MDIFNNNNNNSVLIDLPISDLISIPIQESLNAQTILNNKSIISLFDHIDENNNFKTVDFISELPNGETKKLTLPTLSFYEPCFLSINNIIVDFEISVNSIKKNDSTGQYDFNGNLSINEELDKKYKFNIVVGEKNKSIGITKLQHFLSNNICVK